MVAVYADAGNLPSQAPVGVFDSGVGGLSVLRHIAQQLPHEDLLYFADSGFAPYGEKPEAVIVERSFAIAQYLLAQGAKALVVACNTATVASIKKLRASFPHIPLVGVEPGLKPAAQSTRSGVVGVLATERTLSGAKFDELQKTISADYPARFVLQAATGLAELVEKGQLHSSATRTALQGWLQYLLDQGADTIVLGCTHYPFVMPLMQEILDQIHPQPVQLIDTGEAVARQLQRVLDAQSLQNPGTDRKGHLACYTSGSLSAMQDALQYLLQETAPVSVVHLPSPAAS